ncbi:MAG: prepilin peptidase [Lachnospiraceae bacterium]|nr:prepilin peptidase [Lachnospiraceae bacterium]MBQ8262839.1 prepilin peptidase [Lachnospiraceae bacterium]
MHGLFGFLLLCVIFDVRSFKIPNALILTGLAAVLLFSLWQDGPPGMLYSGLRAAGMFVMLVPLFKIRALGGGDIKLFALIAAFHNFSFCLQILVASLLIGAVHGCFVRIFQIIREEKKRIVIHYSISVALAYFMKMEGWY